MKFFLSILLLSASTVHASVDYIAIGQTVNEIKQSIAESKSAIACSIQAYEKTKTCDNIARLNQFFNSLLLGGQFLDTVSPISSDCRSYAYAIIPLNNRIKYLNERAKDADPNDQIWSVIDKTAKSVKDYETEVNDLITKSKLQETYRTSCLLGSEPPQKSILEQICK